MSKKLMLLIAEKDSECKEYRQVYEKYKAEIPYNIIFTKLRGHVDTIKDNKKENWAKHQFVLPEGFLSWNFNNNAVNDNKTSPYQVAIDGKKYVDAILNLLSKYSFDYIGIGTDGDIEGSTLASAFLSLLPTKYQQIPRLRLFIDDNSEQTILNGLKHMHHDDELMANGLVTYNNFKNSGILRNQLNYVTGISLTRALSVKANGKVKTNIGLVKAPILEIVNARYQQFINFKPQTFYYIQGNISLLNDNKLTVELFNRKTNKRFNFLALSQQMVDF